jgi:putative ABC transport system permease protein
VVASPGSLDDYATSWITALHVPHGDVALTSALIDAYPNISVIDVDAVLDQVRATTDQVATAVSYVFWFTLAAGVIVLIAALGSSNDERMLEAAVMRVLGASRWQLRLAHASEFAALGLIAGLTAAIAASIVSGLIATRVFDLQWAPDWRLATAGAVAGVVVVLVAGLMTTRSVITTPPSRTLRAIRD